MKKIYSIGYVDYRNDFTKVWENGGTRKFETIEQAEQFIQEKMLNSDIVNHTKPIKIMQGWKVIKEVK